LVGRGVRCNWDGVGGDGIAVVRQIDDQLQWRVRNGASPGPAETIFLFGTDHRPSGATRGSSTVCTGWEIRTARPTVRQRWRRRADGVLHRGRHGLSDQVSPQMIRRKDRSIAVARCSQPTQVGMQVMSSHQLLSKSVAA
jgi:hypothetical protein